MNEDVSPMKNSDVPASRDSFRGGNGTSYPTSCPQEIGPQQPA